MPGIYLQFGVQHTICCCSHTNADKSTHRIHTHLKLYGYCVVVATMSIINHTVPIVCNQLKCDNRANSTQMTAFTAGQTHLKRNYPAYRLFITVFVLVSRLTTISYFTVNLP